MLPMHPCIYPDLSDTEYHTDPAIGSTTAVVGLDNEPLLLARLRGEVVTEDKPCFVSGRLMHMAVLEPDRFRELVVSEGPINPRTNAPYERGTKAFARWQEANPHLTMVDPWIHAAIKAMPAPVRGIFALDGTAEASVFLERNGARYKCRPDWWLFESNTFFDLKSISTGGGSIERAIDKAIRARSYWFTIAWYRAVIFHALGLIHGCKLIFVEKEPPHRWRIVDLDFDYLALGDEKVCQMMDKIERGNLGETADDIFYQSAAPQYLIESEE